MGKYEIKISTINDMQVVFTITRDTFDAAYEAFIRVAENRKLEDGEINGVGAENAFIYGARQWAGDVMVTLRRKA